VQRGQGAVRGRGAPGYGAPLLCQKPRQVNAKSAATRPEPVVRGTTLSYHFKLIKNRKNSIQGKSSPNHVWNVGLSLNHTSPQTYNPQTHVYYVVRDPTQTNVAPDTHRLVGVVPPTTCRRCTNPDCAARCMHCLTSFTAPLDGGVEVLVQPPRSRTACHTW